MNTITVQLSDKQYNHVTALLSASLKRLESEMKRAPSEDKKANIMRLQVATASAYLTFTSTKSYLWTSGCGRIEIDIDARHVEAIAVSGDNEPACQAAIREDAHLWNQLDELNMGLAREYLKDAGIDEVEKKSDSMVRVYILWMACWDIHEERNMED